MPISPGVRLGSYEVLSLLGAGGMGEVQTHYSLLGTGPVDIEAEEPLEYDSAQKQTTSAERKEQARKLRLEYRQREERRRVSNE